MFLDPTYKLLGCDNQISAQATRYFMVNINLYTYNPTLDRHYYDVIIYILFLTYSKLEGIGRGRDRQTDIHVNVHNKRHPTYIKIIPSYLK